MNGKLSNEKIDEEWFDVHHLNINNVAKARLFARTIEAAATEPLLQRIVKLEKENALLHRQNTALLGAKSRKLNQKQKNCSMSL